MLMVRLQRVGRKHEPVFRLVLTDSKNGPKSGKFLEILGNFDARRSEKAEFKVERVKHWIESGAKLSDTVHNILVERKVIAGKKINTLPKKSPIVDEAAKAAEIEAATKKEEKTTETIVETPADSAESFVEPKEEVVEEKTL
jgi:small subunit ribosomal protein S16